MFCACRDLESGAGAVSVLELGRREPLSTYEELGVSSATGKFTVVCPMCGLREVSV